MPTDVLVRLHLDRRARLASRRFSLLPLTVLSMAVGGSLLSWEHEAVVVVLDGDVGLCVSRGAQAF